MCKSYNVTVRSRCNVVPAVATPQPSVKKLSNLDVLVCGNRFTKQVFYFNPATSISCRSCVEGLQESDLSHALARYYLLAGRPARCHAVGTHYHINCNDAGVPFLEASTEARFDSWPDGIRRCTTEEQLSPPQPTLVDTDTAALLQVQVTKFGCGGIAIAYAVSEMVVDAHSSFQFFAAWSQVHSSGIANDGFPPMNLSLGPCPLFNLGKLLEARQPPNVNPILHMRSSVKISQLPKGHGPFGTYGRATSFEALSALLWKCITQARALPDQLVTKFTYPISFRNNAQRWETIIPEECFGNAVHVSCLPTKAGGIKSKHISYTANLIHKDVCSISVETVRSTIDWIKIQLEQGNLVGMECDVSGGRDIFIAPLYTFPIYHMDFGFGNPLYYSLVALGDGAAYILPTRDGGRNREISVTLPKIHMKTLINDQLFRTFIKESF
ncbi:hypothetical protein GOP47_0010099 [Adiantum capillus-veneris]|uniref:BAHD family acyltransferase n=1 Tax=Adiantum capillus-veneris TaxID=13818 RepID=A0A9D4ZG09_ADICA|nr:hypothetical protein GOP47_0010099 [Adiantum capillus-veneris]